jgi:hypothetical protein
VEKILAPQRNPSVIIDTLMILECTSDKRNADEDSNVREYVLMMP